VLVGFAWIILGAQGVWRRRRGGMDVRLVSQFLSLFTHACLTELRRLVFCLLSLTSSTAYKFPKAQERLDELKRGGAKVQRSRERLSRSNQKQHEADCVVM